MGGGQLGGPTQSGMMGGMGGPTQMGGQLGGPTQMGGMPGGQNPYQQLQGMGGMLGGPNASPSPFPQGGPLGGPAGMPPHLANMLAKHPEIQGQFANSVGGPASAGGKGGMPGAQQNPMQQMGGGVFGMRRAIADLSNRTGSAPMQQQNPMQQNPMQQQGLASLLKPQQSSTNSLQ